MAAPARDKGASWDCFADSGPLRFPQAGNDRTIAMQALAGLHLMASAGRLFFSGTIDTPSEGANRLVKVDTRRGLPVTPHDAPAPGESVPEAVLRPGDYHRVTRAHPEDRASNRQPARRML
jgi:hypothetical protein